MSKQKELWMQIAPVVLVAAATLGGACGGYGGAARAVAIVLAQICAVSIFAAFAEPHLPAWRRALRWPSAAGRRQTSGG